jgi:hypothetical protein
MYALVVQTLRLVGRGDLAVVLRDRATPERGQDDVQ